MIIVTNNINRKTNRFDNTNTITTNIITSNITGDLASGSVGLSGDPVYYTMGDCHSVFMDHATPAKRYSADIYPADAKTLKGTVSVTSANSNVSVSLQ